MYALKKLIKNSHVKYLNGEFETLENTYSRWQSIQIKLQLTFYQHKYLRYVFNTSVIFPNGAYMYS